MKKFFALTLISLFVYVNQANAFLNDVVGGAINTGVNIVGTALEGGAELAGAAVDTAANIVTLGGYNRCNGTSCEPTYVTNQPIGMQDQAITTPIMESEEIVD